MSTASSPGIPQAEPIVIDGISYIPSSVLLTGIPKTTFKDNHAFAVMNPMGECPRLYAASSELGIYCNDTRHLGIWELTINGVSPVPLAQDVRFNGSTAVFSMTNPDLSLIEGEGRVPRNALLIRRVMTLYDDVLYETVEFKNFTMDRFSLHIEQWAGGRFDDVFEVRGYVRPKRGKMLSPDETAESARKVTVLQYEGLDQKVRKTFIHRLFAAEKIRVSPGLVGYFTRVEVPPKETVAIKTVISFDQVSDCFFKGLDYQVLSVPEKMSLLKESEVLHQTALRVESDNAIVNRAVENAQNDIFMLLTEEPSGSLYPYAGIPWFSAPFGRDGMIAAYQMLPWYPKLAKGVLDYAFTLLGKREDPFTDEQPGKVFHEYRRGEMAKTREIPFIPYYGSVDSTPLTLILLQEYVRWTLDLESLKNWWPEALRAMAWIEKWGDIDGDGFLEYAKKSPSGLVNQGWKDSHDSVMHADGRLAQAPIRLCEVQGYAFRAKMGMAELARVLGKDDIAARFRSEALTLKARFIEKFWNHEDRFVYLALDGDLQPCTVRSSNMGHCLWTQILPPEHAREVSRHLLDKSMFSGHGIRTLADTEVAFNPLSYHNGSVWPHDNSLIMEGLRFYGHLEELETVALGLLSVLESSQDFRLPELFCGFRKRGSEPPIPYEVACKPQAWAAGSVFLMLKSLMGLSMDSDQTYVVFHSPVLTPKINLLEVKGLRGRDWEMDVALRRGKGGTTVDITRRSGNVRVLVVK